MNHRQSELSFSHVVAGGFTDVAIGKIVEDVITNLEANANELAELRGFFHVCCITAGRYGSEACAGSEKCCSFVVNDVEVGFFANFLVTDDGELRNLTFRERPAKTRNDTNNFHILCFSRIQQRKR